jgi:hypothetical protein
MPGPNKWHRTEANLARRRLQRLWLRGGTFYFRAVLPALLRPYLGRRETKLSLRTRDPSIARLRFGEIASNYDQLLFRVRRMAVLNPSSASGLLRSYFEKGLEKVNEIAWAAADDPQFDPEFEAQGLRTEIDDLRKRIASRKLDNALITDARVLMGENGVTHAGVVDENFAIVCTGILRAQAEHRRILVEMLQGKFCRDCDTRFAKHSGRPISDRTYGARSGRQVSESETQSQRMGHENGQ